MRKGRKGGRRGGAEGGGGGGGFEAGGRVLVPVGGLDSGTGVLEAIEEGSTHMSRQVSNESRESQVLTSSRAHRRHETLEIAKEDIATILQSAPVQEENKVDAAVDVSQASGEDQPPEEIIAAPESEEINIPEADIPP